MASGSIPQYSGVKAWDEAAEANTLAARAASDASCAFGPLTVTNFTMSGFLKLSKITKATSYTAASEVVLLMSTSTTLTLPPAATVSGRLYAVKKTDTGTTLTIDGDGAETIDGAATLILPAQYTGVLLYCDGTSWSVLANMIDNLSNPITDPGASGAIPVTRSGTVALSSAAAETRTLAAPSFVGQQICLNFKTDAGDITLMCSTAVNQTGNNTLVFSDIGEFILLTAVNSGSNIRWRVVANDGVVLSTV